jgi:hypothetical protein
MMNTNKYHIYHSEEACTKEDLIKTKLSKSQIEHEYDSLDIALHLFSRLKDIEASFEINPHEERGVVVKVQGFDSEQEADNFIGEFPRWLKGKLSTRFCPVIKKIK